MSWRRLLGRLPLPERLLGGESDVLPAVAARGGAPPAPTRPEAGWFGDEGPVLDEAELKELREELAQELERVARRERQAIG
jgi:hypothetical protein